MPSLPYVGDRSGQRHGKALGTNVAVSRHSETSQYEESQGLGAIKGRA